MKAKKPNIRKSNKLYKKALKIIPSGSQTFSKGTTQFVDGFAPKYLDSGKGAYVRDIDGNKYLDYVMGCHPLILGYADSDVNNAVIKQLKKGSTFSLMNELEYDVSKKVIDAVPSAEMVRFGKNGADATTIGVRIARAYTGRDHIAYCGYHGWHDWFIAKTDLNQGIPEFNKKLAHSFNYNDLDSLERIFKKNPSKIAIVIMEPVAVAAPKCFCGTKCNKTTKTACQNSFLHEVQKMAKHYGALLMFDEIISGFRFSLGGAQELFDVTPDLSSFAKAISNAIPLSAIVGKKEYMSLLDKTFFSFTYGGDCIGLAAANACIPKIKIKKVPDHLNKVGKILKDGINKSAKENNLEDYIQCIGFPCRSILSIQGNGIYDDLELKTYIQQELFRRGILWAAYHAISWSHKKKDIVKTLNAFDEIFNDLRKIIVTRKKISNYLEGKTVQPVFRQVADFNSYITKGK